MGEARRAKNRHAVALGRIGGRMRTPAKVAAARRNGALAAGYRIPGPRAIAKRRLDRAIEGVTSWEEALTGTVGELRLSILRGAIRELREAREGL